MSKQSSLIWPRLGPAIHRVEVLNVVKGAFDWGKEARPVRIMALAEGYAMVRRKGSIPYVAPIKDLFPADSQT